MAPILPISAPTLPSAIRIAGESTTGSDFQNVLQGAIGQVESVRQDATASAERFLTGDGEDLHSTIMATQRAELTFEMFQQVRNKVVSAYQEIMRMQL